MTLEEAHKKLEEDWRELEKQVKQTIAGCLFWRLLTLMAGVLPDDNTKETK